MNRMTKWTFALIPLMMTATSHADTFYKWVDDQGATHYTQTPPPQKSAKKVGISTHTPADSATEIANLNKQTSADLKSADAQDQAAEKAKADAAADAARRKKNAGECQQLQASLAQLQSGQRLRTNDSNGDRNYLTEDQKATQIQQQTAQSKKDCP